MIRWFAQNILQISRILLLSICASRELKVSIGERRCCGDIDRVLT